LNKKSNLRKLLDWEEKVTFNNDRVPLEEEKKSIKHCETGYYTDYKYNIFYEVGKEYTSLDSTLVDLIKENGLYAVSNIL